MAALPDTEIQINDWAGMRSNASPHLIAAGESQVQVNVGEVAEGRLDVRTGFRAVVFEN